MAEPIWIFIAERPSDGGRTRTPPAAVTLSMFEQTVHDPRSWLQYLRMVLGGPPAEMVSTSPGGPSATYRVVTIERRHELETAR